jgi:hypothetical protein
MQFERAVRYPTQRESWLTTVLIGGILLLLGFLLVPLFLVYGYLVRAIRTSTAGDPEPPAFDDWGTLLIDGVQAWLVFFLYMLVPVVTAAVLFGGSVAAIATGSDIGISAGLGGLFVALGVTLVLSLVFGYVAVVALVNFAREGQFGAAFDVTTIKTVALDGDYAVAWLGSVLVFLVVGLFGAVPLIGWALAPVATFYAAVVAAALWADGFDAAVEGRGNVTPSRDREPMM